MVYYIELSDDAMRISIKELNKEMARLEFC